MKNQIFSLNTFQQNIFDHDLNININTSRNLNSFFIHYELFGKLSEIVFPKKSVIPSRKNNLWNNTCFEFFVAIKDLPRYWEFNISPSGDWNVYSFLDYRNGMMEERAFTSLPFKIQNQSESFQLDLECDLGNIVNGSKPLEMAISAVIEYKNNELSYWALTHCGCKADFHLRESFIIQL